MERDGYRCISVVHAPECTGQAQEVHHAVYRSALESWAYWVVGNGFSVHSACHRLSHTQHNANLGARANEAVKALNVLYKQHGLKPLPKFRKKAL